jgi:CHASE2 domain-containing sensor protein
VATATPGSRRLRHKGAALAAIVALAFGVGLTVQLTGLLGGLERQTLQTRFDLRGAERPDDVVVVAIDARSFDQLRRQWPFPRSLHARAIDRLHAAGAREIVYDVQFTEPTEPREDVALFRAVRGAGGAVLATSESDGRGHTNVLGGEANLRGAHARAGASDLENDDGAVITRLPYEVAGLHSLAVVTAERLGLTVPRAPFGDKGAWIDFRGPPGTIRTVSFSDVLEGRFDPSVFRNRVVVIGASAPTLRDVHATTAGGDQLMAGAEVQANAIWTALHGAPLRSAGLLAGLLVLLGMSAVAPLVRARFPVAALAVAVPLAAGAFLVLAQLAFDADRIVAIVPPLIALLVATALTIGWSHLAETRVRRAVEIDNELLEAAVRERTRELRETQLEIARRLGVAVEWRDAETGVHIERIGIFCERLALAAGMAPAAAEELRHASALHDVGKVGIADGILTKPGALDEDEWEAMRTHTTIGASILAGSSSELVQLAETIALTHHERWDGTGYPRGLAGEEIPLAGRICAICDVFDALLSPRPYKEPWPLNQVLAEMRDGRGGHFDPRLLDIFMTLAPELHREWFAGTLVERVASPV